MLLASPAQVRTDRMRRSWLIAFIALPLALSSPSALAQQVDYDRDARRYAEWRSSVIEIDEVVKTP